MLSTHYKLFLFTILAINSMSLLVHARPSDDACTRLLRQAEGFIPDEVAAVLKQSIHNIGDQTHGSFVKNEVHSAIKQVRGILKKMPNSDIHALMQKWWDRELRETRHLPGLSESETTAASYKDLSAMELEVIYADVTPPLIATLFQLQLTKTYNKERLNQLLERLSFLFNELLLHEYVSRVLLDPSSPHTANIQKYYLDLDAKLNKSLAQAK